MKTLSIYVCVCIYLHTQCYSLLMSYMHILHFVLLLDILFIYISIVISFPSFPSANSLSHLPLPCYNEGALPPTYPLPHHHPSIPLHWGIKPSQNQGPPLPLMPDKVILCYICSGSHGSSLFGGFVLGALRDLVG